MGEVIDLSAKLKEKQENQSVDNMRNMIRKGVVPHLSLDERADLFQAMEDLEVGRIKAIFDRAHGRLLIKNS